MQPVSPITRREFLKLARLGALGLALPDLGLAPSTASPPASQGRMVLSGIGLYTEPAFNAKKIHAFGRDEIVRLTAAVDGDEGNPYNRTWYEIDRSGYTYSGWVQPVETFYQKADWSVTGAPRLGEVSVPFSITRREPYYYARNGMRIYYGCTYWVQRVVVTREEKGIWYEIYDAEMNATLFVPYYEMRLVPEMELQLLSPEVPEVLKYIHIDLATQMVTAFEGEKMVHSTRCSSGAKGTRTPQGEFRTYHKGPSIHMSNEGDAETNTYDLPGVPWVSFFTGTGVALHGTYWHNDFGRPRSHGCVNLPTASAKFFYRWSRPVVPPATEYLHLPGEGTRVQVESSQAADHKTHRSM